MNGFLLIDKPLNITSFDVIRELRKILNIKKIGHTGTLDPLATGGLLIAVGNYTKLIPHFEKDTKVYNFTVRFDGVSDSFDLGTEVNYLDKKILKKAKKDVTKEYLEKVLKENFTGKIKQLPPKYSALKIGGKKAVDLVREGKDFTLKERICEIFYIKITNFNFPEVTFEAKVSAGTYIRSIASDLGDLFGTGGYITKLRRTKIGKLDLSLASKLEGVSENNYLDTKNLFDSEKFIKLDDDDLEKIDNGLCVSGDFNFRIGEALFIFGEGFITNIIFYDGENLIPKKKIL